MQATQIDADDFRARQRRDWNEASEGWRDWNELIDRATAHVSEHMVSVARIQPGYRVLDVAAGYGEPSLTAAKVVGPQGEVVATDISAGMLAYGRERASAAGLENVRFVESDASSLDFPQGSFDAALSRWGIIFEPDGEGAATRVRSFLKPAAKMAISSWGPPERVPFLAVPMSTVMKTLDVPPPPPGTPGPLSRPTAEAIGGLLEGGGFSDVEVDELEVSFEWGSPEEFTRFVQEIAPPIYNLVNPQPPDVQRECWQAITDAARAHASGGGALRFSNLVLVAAGRS
ncbi:MAG: methyltransferase domain-containing protein [Actinobacteria bacterium]|nr:MAG: methyltransferase domain-containing protein [Actinomycetota bacterium]